MNSISKYTINIDASIKDALILLDKLSDDAHTLFVLHGKRLVGTITDGDIRRALIKDIPISTSVEDVMNKEFKYVRPQENDIQKIRALRAYGIQLLPCISENGELLRIYNLKKKKSLLPINVVLMAGGRGERLRPLTEKIPKPLLPIGDKAIIDYNVDRLIEYGIEDIYITTNYLAEQIEQHFEKERDHIKIKCFREEKYLGTIASIKSIPFVKNDDVLVMNSDLFTNIDFEEFYRFFKENDADMSVAAVPYSVSIPYGIIELEGKKITAIKEKPTYNHYVNAGIYIIKRSLLDLIPDNIFYDATDFINLLTSIGKSVIRYPLVGYWVDIGKHEDYKKVQDLVKHLDLT